MPLKLADGDQLLKSETLETSVQRGFVLDILSAGARLLAPNLRFPSLGGHGTLSHGEGSRFAHASTQEE